MMHPDHLRLVWVALCAGGAAIVSTWGVKLAITVWENAQ